MIPERYAPMTYALFRIVFGFLFLCFGLQNVFGILGGTAVDLASMGGAAGLIETTCGLLIMIGLFTRYAAFLASGEMAVAFWYIHVRMSGTIIPVMNMGVDATVFCFAFLYICTRGSGIWSVDALMKRP
jgi:putative oxidoreductase